MGKPDWNSAGAPITAHRDKVQVVESAPLVASKAKRSFDIVVACAAILMTAPLVALLALAIRVETRGPAIFRQQRAGLGGRSFTVYKLRTMIYSEATGNHPAAQNDPRVTRLGAVLRRLSLDELPQLYNVLRGEMSLVGPRPHAVDHDVQYLAQIESYKDRYRARPGITGLAQISGSRGGGDVFEMRRRTVMDNRYIDDWSMALDIKIIALTIPHLLSFRPH